MLDFVDGKSRQLAWRGQAKGFVDKNSNPRKDEKLVNEAVRKVEYSKPYSEMVAYLDQMLEAPFHAVGADDEPPALPAEGWERI